MGNESIICDYWFCDVVISSVFNWLLKKRFKKGSKETNLEKVNLCAVMYLVTVPSLLT